MRFISADFIQRLCQISRDRVRILLLVTIENASQWNAIVNRKYNESIASWILSKCPSLDKNGHCYQSSSVIYMPSPVRVVFLSSLFSSVYLWLDADYGGENSLNYSTRYNLIVSWQWMLFFRPVSLVNDQNTTL